ncbi:pseudoazurin [Devosia submarina]|uniref:pseudoazurin n=1 Tax=Devosia submarina TaxID=1173082 RepID=UPI000D360547|nr:pseudoazurin [Devosia submarina]
MRVSALPIAAGIAILMSASATMAADHQVQMLNKDSEGRAMQFEPAFLKIAPGDTVTFVATTKGHNSESIVEIMPEGATPWKGKINQEITVTFDQEGFYAYKCQPHLGMGMVGLIQVGDSSVEIDPALIEKLPTRPEDRLKELLAEAAATDAGTEAAASAAQ